MLMFPFQICVCFVILVLVQQNNRTKHQRCYSFFLYSLPSPDHLPFLDCFLEHGLHFVFVFKQYFVSLSDASSLWVDLVYICALSVRHPVQNGGTKRTKTLVSGFSSAFSRSTTCHIYSPLSPNLQICTSLYWVRRHSVFTCIFAFVETFSMCMFYF